MEKKKTVASCSHLVCICHQLDSSFETTNSSLLTLHCFHTAGNCYSHALCCVQLVASWRCCVSSSAAACFITSLVGAGRSAKHDVRKDYNARHASILLVYLIRLAAAIVRNLHPCVANLCETLARFWSLNVLNVLVSCSHSDPPVCAARRSVVRQRVDRIY